MAKKDSLKNKSRKVGEHVVEFLDMPQEVILDVPKVTCVGQSLITIENHRGIVEYSPQKIRINVSVGEVEITGSNLRVKNILPEEVDIEGTIKNISFK
ncbi:MAG: hypothetical protein PWQ96_622 [Clostridia bacterium]|jgi:sporulation protein YqfC|nr:hypothetical protein [Clostridiales bacterium]MDK2984980.1 hypothetical protein [Clostridia bacterium]